jgi:hypothetical protein
VRLSKFEELPLELRNDLMLKQVQCLVLLLGEGLRRRLVQGILCW